jgi:Ca-activated chloride channel family protein
MRFLRPEYGWWLLGAMAILIVIRWRGRRRYAASTTVDWIDRASRASPLRRLPFVTLAAALALAGLGFMEPVLPFAESEVKSHGLDIVMVLDLSSSMLEPIGIQALQGPMVSIVEGSTANVVRPKRTTRLDATKEAIKSFVAHRHDDRVGLVVFSTNAYVVSPLSLDYEYLRRYVDMVDDQILRGEGMTGLGEGIAVANYLLARQTVPGDGRGRVVVLFTDGENNRGRDPVDALNQADAAGVRVHIVGVDIEAKVRKKREVERVVAAVRGHGGRYFDATTVADLNAASRVIDGIEKGPLTSMEYVHDVPVFHWFVIPAIACLTLTMALGTIPHFTDLT